MNQIERRKYLIDYLKNEDPQYAFFAFPKEESEQRRYLRTFLNIRQPLPITADFLKVQDKYLQEEIKAKGIVDYHKTEKITNQIYLYKGDITLLKCDAVVNAANEELLGCFIPCHTCIDNAIHTYAGVQLRLKCAEIIKEQGHLEKVGEAKITPGYNLPCRYIIHTVGPQVDGNLTEKEENELRSCYQSCLKIALENHVASLAFCCLSTG